MRKLAVAGAGVAGVGSALLITLSRLGRSYGATRRERAASLPGRRHRRTSAGRHRSRDHDRRSTGRGMAWLVQMGWHRGGWYTARWVDRLLFPANQPIATQIIPELQNLNL